jgi:hypothetical protein
LWRDGCCRCGRRQCCLVLRRRCPSWAFRCSSGRH